ncbi:MAG: DNA-directed RNA polymerase subunit delta [Bacilli bacterium]|nr:DNA-directed RNA polymerase subunit delta [Bacilli bacterium]
MAKKAMIEYAYEIMQEKKSISFTTLWASVAKKAELTNEQKEKALPNFYTQLSLDGRFVALGNNKWSLRDRLPYEKVHVDLSDFYNDLEEETEGDEDEEAETKKDESAHQSEENQNI